MDKFWDKFEEKLMRLAGKGYLTVGIMSFVFILWQGSWRIRTAAVLMIVCFTAYSLLDPDPEDNDDRDS